MNNQTHLPDRASLLVTSLALTMLLAGCATAPTAPSAQQTTVSCKVPSIAPTGETTERQDRGGIEISVVPVLYKAVLKETVALKQTQPSMGSLIGVSLATGGNSRNQVFVEQTTTPYLEVAPARLQFSVRINNKLARVFRGQGAVVQFIVAGKQVDFGQTDYKEFMNGIVPPRNEATLNIFGPALETMPDSGTIGIFLYDVVTATDTAGNVTEKQNFEWYFTYTKNVESRSAQIQVARGYMDVATFQQRMMQQQMEEVRRTMGGTP